MEAFSIPETAPKGRYLSGPATWGGYDEERVAALGLDFEVVHAGTDAALFAELQSAYDRKAPVILWVYAPHWAPASSRASGSSSPLRARPATATRSGAPTPTPPTTAASPLVRSGRSHGPA